MSLTNYPKVSIMIPSCNQEEYIAQAIESALNQDYPNLEIVVSDDCSTDDSLEMIKKFQENPRLKCFRNERNLGFAENNRKLLCDYASGDWVVMLDGDDYFVDKQFVRIAIEEMSRHKNVVAVISGHRVFYLDKEYSFMPSEAIKLVNGYNLFIDFLKITPGHSSVVYKRELAIKIGGYSGALYNDYAMFLKMFIHGNVLLLNRIAYVWRHHGKNISDRLDFNEQIESKKFIEESHRYTLELGHNRNQLNKWEKRMLSWYFNAYISKNTRSLRRKLITKKDADRNINLLIKYLFKNEKSLLFSDVNIFGRIITYKFLGPKLFEFIAHFVNKIKFRNRYALIKKI